MEVKIIEFWPLAKGRAERKLARLVSQGWRIVGTGGWGSFPSGYVVLQLDTPVGQGTSEQGERQFVKLA